MTANAARIGLDCKLYRNSGTYGTPTWTEVTEAQDVSLPGDTDKGEAKSRGSVFKMTLPGHVGAPLEFGLLYDNTKANFGALQTAWLGRSLLDMAMADGAIATSGTSYWRADYYIYGFGLDQPLSNPSTVPVKMDLAYSAHVPAFATAP